MNRSIDTDNMTCGAAGGNASEPASDCISALADGRLHGVEFERAVAAVLDDARARGAWHSYHVIGEVLRFGETAGRSADSGFAARFAARLEQEPALARPDGPAEAFAIEAVAENDLRTSASAVNHAENRPREAANSPNFRWKVVAGLATVAAIGAIGWNSLGSSMAPNGAAQLAKAPSAARQQVAAGLAPPSSLPSAVPPVVADSGPAPMVRDPRLDELLAAHERAAGISALQPAGFLRNATFEGRGR